jgi:pSer/pThr/pTyr-binding forkhead associated (FHA) protein
MNSACAFIPHPACVIPYDLGVPLIRCQKCAQAYDVPGVVAVRLASSIATCHCGEWLAGSKAAILARMLNPEQINEIDLQPYRVEHAPDPVHPFLDANEDEEAPFAETALPRSIRIIARGAKESVSTIFTIDEHPLWIGRKGCHVELDEADLSLRHCSIYLRGNDLVVRDADSHMGTFLDGQPVEETVIPDGVHILRAGSALISLEPTGDPGIPVEPIRTAAEPTVDESVILRKLQERQRESSAPKRSILVCIEGALQGQEFEIPATGLIVGREGHVRVPDEFLSRKHFEVLPDADGTIRVRDLGSRNGTFLNTLPARNTKVHGGDEIRAGVNRFRIDERV